MNPLNEMEAAKAKILRGDIIEKLYLYYGNDIRIAVLKSALRANGFVEDSQIKKAVYYLGGEGKRFLHVEVDKDNWMDSLIWLTPAGVNLAEGDLEDVGVEMDG